MGHALSTPFGALKHDLPLPDQVGDGLGHALSTPFGALKPFGGGSPASSTGLGACPLNALRGTETVKSTFFFIAIPPGGMPSQRPSGH